MAKKNRALSKNSFKEEGNSKKAKKKKASKSKLNVNLSNRLGFLKDERFQKIFGLFVMLLSVFLFISFISFFISWFNWDNDDIYSSISFHRVLFDTQIETSNWMGRLGAACSQLFVKNWFGVASFILLIDLFAIGFKSFFRSSLFSFNKLWAYSIFSILWISLFMGFVFNGPKSGIFGGVVGFESIQFLNGLMGKGGTLILLFFALASFLIASFQIHLWIKSLFVKDEIHDENPVVDGLTIDDLANLHAEQNEDEEISGEGIELVADIHEKSQDEETASDELEILNLDIEESKPEEEVPIDAMDKEADEFSVEVAEGDNQDENTEADSSETETSDHGVDTEYDPKEDLSDFKAPPIDFLQDHGSSNQISINKEELEANKNKIVKTLSDYSIKIEKIKATIGPTITLYEIVPAPGIRISKIKNLEDDIALSLAALGIRIIAPIPGRGTIGIEVPNQKPEIVSMRTVLSSEKFQNFKGELPVAIGKTISNETFVFDLTKMPHLLMAGATGQGKSVGLNAVITSILYKKHPAQVKFVMVDPKKVELSLFSKIERHYLAKLPEKAEAIITDVKDVVTTLNSLCLEMDSRYDLLKSAMVRNIKEYNEKFIQRKLNPQNGHRYLPYIVLVVDEFADLIMTAGKEVEGPIARLAQLARAIGIHLIIATQRPSVNIITGVIKANFPARIAFRVTSKIDSRTILDTGGADQLIGRGDMLFSTGSNLVRIQCAFVDTPEVEEITDFIGKQRGYSSALELPEYEDESSSQSSVDMDDRDPMFEEAARLLVQHQQGSTSLIQRKLKLGYNRAGRIIDQLEAAGIVGPFEGSKAREVKISDLNFLEQFLESLNGN